MKLLDLTEDQMKIISRASMVASAIDPRNPRVASIELLRELNVELKEILNQKT